MGKFLKILLGVGVVGGLGIGGALYMTSGLTDTADAFFKALKSQDVATVRSLLAQETSQNLNDRALKRLMANESIAAYRDASYSNRRVSGSRGELDGTFTTTAGAVVPVRFVLVQEGEVWKVHGFKTGG